MNDQTPVPVPERANDPEVDTTSPEPQPVRGRVEQSITTDPDDSLSYIALGAIVVFLALCASLILIAYVNGPA